EDAEHDALEPQARAALELADRVGDAGPGDNAQADEAVGCDGAVVLGEEVVVPADHGTVGVVVADAAPEGRPGAAGEEPRGGVAVLALPPQPLLGGAGARRGLVVLADRAPAVASFAAIQVPGHLAQGAAFHQPGIAAIGKPDEPRHPLTVRRG